MIKFTVIMLTLSRVAAYLSLEPLVHWSMDLYNNSMLLPDFGDAKRYSCDLQVYGLVNYLMPGVEGYALYLSNRKINLVEDMRKSDCLRNPVRCEDGLTISFWLNIHKLSAAKYQPIMRTLDPTRRRPGVYIGESDGEKLNFIVRTAEGKNFQASIPFGVVHNKWSHLVMCWNSSLGIQISINSSLLSDDMYEEPPTVENVSSSYPSKVDFIVGDIPGPTFSLDDLWIFYHKLTKEDVYSLFERGIPEEQPPPDVFTAGNELLQNSTSLKFDTTQLNQEVKTEVGISTNMQTTSARSFLNETEVQETVNSTTAMHSTNPSTTLSPATNKPIVSQGPKTTTTPYTGWFYLQPWYYSMLGAVVLSLIILCTWLCITHCFIPAVEERKCSKTNGEQTAMEGLLIQKNVMT